MGVCKLNHWSQSRLHNYTAGIILLWVTCTSLSPLDFQFRQGTCFGQHEASRHGANRNLKCACTTRPACLYLSQDHEKSKPWTTAGPRGWETCGADPEPTHSLDPSPANPQPTCTRMRENAVLSHWVGVSSIQHYWSKSWLREQSDNRNMGRDFINHTDTNSSDNKPFPHRFPKHVFKYSIWVAAFFFFFFNLRLQALSSNKTALKISNVSRKPLQI